MRTPRLLTVGNGKSVACEQAVADESMSSTRHAKGYVAVALARLVALGFGASRLLIALVLGRPEHHHTEEQEEQPNEHNTARPFGEPNDARIHRRLVGDPRLFYAAGGAYRRTANDLVGAEPARDGLRL